MKNITWTISLIVCCLNLSAQTDSSAIFEKRIAGGGTKTWYFISAAINDAPSHQPQPTLQITQRPKSAKYTKPMGRQLPIIRNYTSWFVKKGGDGMYLLNLSNAATYHIQFSKDDQDNWVLMLSTGVKNAKPASGVYGEKRPTP